MVAKTPGKLVRDFRLRHGLTAEDMDELMGFSSKGRATRRWEAENAPSYVAILIAYMDRHGLSEARKIAGERING